MKSPLAFVVCFATSFAVAAAQDCPSEHSGSKEPLQETYKVADYSGSVIAPLLKIASLKSFTAPTPNYGHFRFSYPGGKILSLQIWFYESADAARDEFAAMFQWFPSEAPATGTRTPAFDERHVIRVGDSETNLGFRKGEFVVRVYGNVGWSGGGAPFVGAVTGITSDSQSDLKEFLGVRFDLSEAVRAKASSRTPPLSVEEENAAKEVLVAALTDGDLSPKECIRKLLLLGSLKDPSTAFVFRKYLDPKYSFTVRQYALRGLGQTDDRSMLPALKRMLEQPPSGDISDSDEPKEAIERRRLVDVVAKLEGKASMPFLQECLKRDDYGSVKEVIRTRLEMLKREARQR